VNWTYAYETGLVLAVLLMAIWVALNRDDEDPYD